jgi:hypothetical protein
LVAGEKNVQIWTFFGASNDARAGLHTKAARCGAHDWRLLSEIHNELGQSLYFRCLRNTMLKISAKEGCGILILRIKLVESESGYLPAGDKKAQGTTLKKLRAYREPQEEENDRTPNARLDFHPRAAHLSHHAASPHLTASRTTT